MIRFDVENFSLFSPELSNNVGRKVSEMSTSSASFEFNCCLLIDFVMAHDGYKFGIMSSIGSGLWEIIGLSLKIGSTLTLPAARSLPRWLLAVIRLIRQYASRF